MWVFFNPPPNPLRKGGGNKRFANPQRRGNKNLHSTREGESKELPRTREESNARYGVNLVI